MPLSPSSIPTTLRVIVVDDDPDFLSAVVGAIHGAADMVLQGTAGSCAQARALLTREPADLMLLDLGLPDGPGVALIAQTIRAWPSCLVMVSTVFGDEAHVIQSLEAGAIGYLLKDSDGRHIVEEIRSAAAGGSPISPLIARRGNMERRAQALGARLSWLPLAPGTRFRLWLPLA